jgi:hypothetical protein
LVSLSSEPTESLTLFPPWHRRRVPDRGLCCWLTVGCRRLESSSSSSSPPNYRLPTEALPPLRDPDLDPSYKARQSLVIIDNVPTVLPSPSDTSDLLRVLPKRSSFSSVRQVVALASANEPKIDLIQPLTSFSFGGLIVCVPATNCEFGRVRGSDS